jgi:membrane-associated phospholipid phosphatase
MKIFHREKNYFFIKINLVCLFLFSPLIFVDQIKLSSVFFNHHNFFLKNFFLFFQKIFSKEFFFIFFIFSIFFQVLYLFKILKDKKDLDFIFDKNNKKIYRYGIFLLLLLKIKEFLKIIQLTTITVTIAFLFKKLNNNFIRPSYLLGNKNTHHSGFPSGHVIFCFLIVLILNQFFLIKIKKTKTLVTLVCLIVSFSRIYLLKHFFIDVYFSVLLCTFLTIIFFDLNDFYD